MKNIKIFAFNVLKHAKIMKKYDYAAEMDKKCE